MNNGKICVSVCAETADELIEQIKCAEDLADVIEIRFDCLNENEFHPALQILSELNSKKPFLATFRPQNYDSDLTPILRTKEDFATSRRKSEARKYRLKSWKEIIKSGKLSLIDIEPDFRDLLYHNISFSLLFDDNSDIESDINFANNFRDKILIVSYHDFEKIPDSIEKIYENLSLNCKDVENEVEELQYLTADVIKIAAQADEITDTISVWKLLEKAKSENKQVIPIAMGEAGKWTRILGLANGAFMTYAALDAGRETAPGQISAQDLIEIYRVKELDENTEVYGIVGGDTSYSMSPPMHNAAFKYHNLNAVFIPLQVGDLHEFMRRMVKPATREIELNFKGFAVTMPHKQAVIAHLDSIDETAQAIGAVNTVKIENGKFYGFNTDARGFIEPLLDSYGDLKDARVAIFGAGGAARACVYALKKEGANVTIFARDVKKAERLADEFQVELKELSNPENRNPKTDFNDFDILVNSTPLGRTGNFVDETPFFAEQIENVKLVYDLNYNPFQTKLMDEADKAGVPKIGGLAMLVAQAMAQQKIWTGKNAPMREMSRAALKKLQ